MKRAVALGDGLSNGYLALAMAFSVLVLVVTVGWRLFKGNSAFHCTNSVFVSRQL